MGQSGNLQQNLPKSAMTYSAFIEELFQRRTKKRVDLTLMTRLLNQWGNPHLTYPIIHIAGTNGKGTVASKIAAALTKGGYKTGLYTSPHLFDYEERIQINGEKIPKETVLQYDLELSKDLEPNFFECTTCYGFRYFAEEKVDIAIIEAGLGGGLDSTNVVKPILSIITSIGLDHTEILGNSLEEIAAEKAGVIKAGTPVIVGPKAQLDPIINAAQEKKAPFHLAEDLPIKALELISKGFPLSREAIEIGLAYRPPCRFEKRGNVILDVAHNPDSFVHLKAALEREYPHHTIRFVIGMSKNKDLTSCMQQIAGLATHIYFVQADHPDSASPEELADVLEAISDCSYSLEETPPKGIKKAKAAIASNDLLVICGSFYVMPLRPSAHESQIPVLQG